MTPVYFILGTPGSGRREIVRELIEFGLEAGEPATILLSENEASSPADEKLLARTGTSVMRVAWTPETLPDVKLPAGGPIFFLADPQADPITQLESLKPWLVGHNVELGRIFMVVDCQLAEKQPALRLWYQACIHFSDVVFLTKREGVANKWISEFLRYYQDECFPCLFLQVKKNGLPNPAVVLVPEPRRVSQYFDEEDLALPDVEIETDDEEDDEEANEDLPAPEPYFERHRNNRRAKELPDIRDYLPAK